MSSGILDQIQKRQSQKRTNNFIKSLNGKSDKYVQHAYLDNKEFENNEIVLSYIFFNHPNLIKILPTEFQVARINSNLTQFDKASDAVKKKVVSGWLKDNKFFMNSNVVGFDEEETNSYLRLYFKQPEDIAKLYMDDLRRVMQALVTADMKETEKVLETIKDELNDAQWEYVIEVSPNLIKYSTQSIQDKYSSDEKYNKYINGDARNKYIETQLEKINNDFSIFYTVNIDTQYEYIKKHTYMLNYLDEKTLTDLLKYDIDLIQFTNMSILKENSDKTQEIIYGLLENLENKSIKEIVDLLINKSILTAKGKLYKYDKSNDDLSVQYSKRALLLLQNLSINQICSLINIDVNYCLPYIIPIYNENEDIEKKEAKIIEANSRCLKLFKNYYDEETYAKFYKVINKIYVEIISNVEKYNYETDYNCIYDLFKILFNKKIISNNKQEKITVYIGMSLLYKACNKNDKDSPTIDLLNELVNNAYNINIKLDREIYDISSLELYDPIVSFIDRELLEEYNKHNYLNISSLLLLCKSDKARKCLSLYYNYLIKIYGKTKATLYRAVENFSYYYQILTEVSNQKISKEEEVSLIYLLSSFGNPLNISKRNQLLNYDLLLLKKLVEDLSGVKDINIYKNVLANYLFNRGYDSKGSFGWLDTQNIKELISIYTIDSIEELEVNYKKVFDKDEVALFSMMKLLFETNDFTMLLSYIENLITTKPRRNIIKINSFFNKLKKHKNRLINSEIVTIKDIELLYKERPETVKKSENKGVTVYKVINQDFKVLYSIKNDKSNFHIDNALSISKNVYAYNMIKEEVPCHFTEENDKILIKYDKDDIKDTQMTPDFLLVTGSLSDDLVQIAKDKQYDIVHVVKDE